MTRRYALGGWMGLGGRPLVVIDPEDREVVAGLADALSAAGYEIGDRTQDLQAALRVFAGPPKPPEPTGLGAVVEDADGRLWIRVHRDGVAKWRTVEITPRRDAWADWSGIAAVEVLSPGWDE